jgi:DNA-binding transcriptional LysR family regulator
MLFGSWVLSDLIADFLQKNPDIQVDMVLTDQSLDLIQEGIDVAFRVGVLADSSLIARPLGEVKIVTCASPEYIEQHGTPEHPQDLKNHNTLGWSHSDTWEFDSPEQVSVDIKPRVHVNDAHSLHKLALNGVGIGRVPTFLCANDIKEGRLKPILCNWDFKAVPIHALYPSNRHLSVKVRSFVDYVVDELRQNQPWEVDFGEGHNCDALNK